MNVHHRARHSLTVEWTSAGEIVRCSRFNRLRQLSISRLPTETSVYEPTVNSDQLPGLCAAALEAIPRPVIVSNHTTILFANIAAARVFGAQAASQIIGLPANELLHPDCHATAAMRRQLLAESNQGLHDLPSKVVGVDGSIISTVTHAQPIELDGEAAFVYTGGLAAALASRS